MHLRKHKERGGGCQRGGEQAGTHPTAPRSARFSPIAIQGGIHPTPALNEREQPPRGVWATLLEADQAKDPWPDPCIFLNTSMKAQAAQLIATLLQQDQAAPDTEKQAVSQARAR